MSPKVIKVVQQLFGFIRLRNNMDFLLLRYDDHQGNLGRDSELLSLLKKYHFICKAGYWGCPWYFIDIDSKCFYPGRPGLEYGRVITTIDINELRKLLNRQLTV